MHDGTGDRIDEGTLASRPQRLLGYVVDLSAIFALWWITVPLVEPSSVDPLWFPTSPIALCLFCAWYTLFEWLLGATPGKLLTSYRVRSRDGSKPGFLACLIRAVSRLLPGEPLSCLIGEGPAVAWHDILSKTRAVRVEPEAVPREVVRGPDLSEA